MRTKYIGTDATLQAINETLDSGTLEVSLNQNLNISEVNATIRKGGAYVDTLGKNLGIGLEAANWMRAVTTQQRGAKSMIYPSLNRRRITNHRHMRYHCLSMQYVTDTMYFKIKSRPENTVSHIFSTVNGWTRALPLKKEADAHEARSLLAKWDGVPEVMVMDGAKAQVQDNSERSSGSVEFMRTNGVLHTEFQRG
jgi:hypothetical protein